MFRNLQIKKINFKNITRATFHNDLDYMADCLNSGFFNYEAAEVMDQMIIALRNI